MKIARRLASVCAIGFGVIWLAAAAAPAANPVPAWTQNQQAAAAKYLDNRMIEWWDKSKTLKTGGGEVKCVSCHTAVPYAWARAALRRAQHVTEPTSHEERILDIVRRRVAYAADDQPYYDHTEDKKVESRGVEAVINAVILTSRDGESSSTDTAPNPATTAALTRMWEVQRADGAWDWLDFGLEPYEAPDAAFAGATMAALAAGSPTGRRASDTEKGRAGLDHLRAYVHASLATQRLFNRTWALLASSRLDGLLTKTERDAILHDLDTHQRPDGGWSLPDLGTWRWKKQEAPFAPPGTTDTELLATSDGYATGLVVYAMRQAGRTAADSVAVRKGQQWLIDHQIPERPDDPAWAPWRAHSLNFDREHGGPKGEPWRRMFMSDLATSFAVLALL
jgi:squalene-hopene/tetraprenyl-beta-curcumene cyclase